MEKDLAMYAGGISFKNFTTGDIEAFRHVLKNDYGVTHAELYRILSDIYQKSPAWFGQFYLGFVKNFNLEAYDKKIKKAINAPCRVKLHEALLEKTKNKKKKIKIHSSENEFASITRTWTKKEDVLVMLSHFENKFNQKVQARVFEKYLPNRTPHACKTRLRDIKKDFESLVDYTMNNPHEFSTELYDKIVELYNKYSVSLFNINNSKPVNQIEFDNQQEQQEVQEDQNPQVEIKVEKDIDAEQALNILKDFVSNKNNNSQLQQKIDVLTQQNKDLIEEVESLRSFKAQALKIITEIQK